MTFEKGKKNEGRRIFFPREGRQGILFEPVSKEKRKRSSAIEEDRRESWWTKRRAF